MSTLKYLLQYQTFVDHLLCEPVQEFQGDANCIYMHMHIGDWWWQIEIYVRVFRCYLNQVTLLRSQSIY